MRDIVDMAKKAGLASWKSSVLGLLVLLLASIPLFEALEAGRPITTEMWRAWTPWAIAAAGLIVVRDNDKTSKQAKAEPEE